MAADGVEQGVAARAPLRLAIDLARRCGTERLRRRAMELSPAAAATHGLVGNEASAA